MSHLHGLLVLGLLLAACRGTPNGIVTELITSPPPSLTPGPAKTANGIAFTSFATIAPVTVVLAYRPLFELPVPGRHEGGLG